ncbi:hypothetical protein G6F24_017058 [Rhizopus arrhizus]|nr:hypothetical protein G6F24_017058 [Rhizopus arrhizus]
MRSTARGGAPARCRPAATGAGQRLGQQAGAAADLQDAGARGQAQPGDITGQPFGRDALDWRMVFIAVRGRAETGGDLRFAWSLRHGACSQTRQSGRLGQSGNESGDMARAP